MDNTITYSEIFHSIQGEGHYTGVPTAWVRFFLCNLNCDGFGQKDPKDPSTYDLPYKEVNLSGIKKLEDLPVFERGCDSSYSWSKRFKHLQYKDTPRNIAEKLRDTLMSGWNPGGFFTYDGKKQHLCFTGGEPLLPRNQRAIIAILNELFAMQPEYSSFNVSTFPEFVTFETNGTQRLTSDFEDSLNEYQEEGIEFFFSVSPKLFSVSGEKRERAIKPDIVSRYFSFGETRDFPWFPATGQFKFVMNEKEECWDEMEDVLSLYRTYGIDYPVWIMPVGATEESQKDIAGEVATKALQRGYNVSARVHTYLWGNKIGT